MWKISIVFALFLFGCFASMDAPKVVCQPAIYKACNTYCFGKFKVLYRNSTTCFCECVNERGKFTKRSIVIGSLGTLYK